MFVEGYSYKSAKKGFWFSIGFVVIVCLIIYYVTKSFEISVTFAIILLVIDLAVFGQALFYQYQLKRRGFPNLDKDS